MLKINQPMRVTLSTMTLGAGLISVVLAFVLPTDGMSALNLIYNPFVCILLMIGTAVFALDRHIPAWTQSLLVVVGVAYLMAYFVIFSGADWSLFYDQFLNHEKMKGHYHILIPPLILVAKISIYSCIFSTLIGLFLAVLRSGGNIFLNYFITGYVIFFRAIPAIVLVVLVYFALPFVGIGLVSTTSVIVSLSVMFGAYTTEVFRSGIESVHRTQVEASKSLGLSSWQTMRWIILPQALRVVIPPLTGVLIDVLKTTSIAYVVGVPELIARARQLEGALGTVTPLIIVSCLYLLIVLPMVLLSSHLEKRSRRWSARKAV